nr:hairy and enhancer of split-related protein HELT isoform X2 [Oncorhynchus nerka]
MIKDALWTADTQDFDAILPFCTSAFSNSPRIQGTSTPSRHIPDPNRQRSTVAQVHCSESSPPENYCWAGNLLLHEPALQGQDCPETGPAESGTLEGKSHTPPVSAIRHNKRQKSRDSAPAKNGTDDHINLELGDSGAPSIPNETPKRPVFNDMSDVDDQLFCDAANLIDPVNSTASIPAAEQERFQLHSSPESLQSHSPNDSVFQQSPPGHFSWHSTARSPTISYPTVPLSAPTQQHHGGYLSPVQGLDHHYFNFFNGHPHANAFSLHSTQHAL